MPLDKRKRIKNLGSGMLGKRHSEKTKRKMREAALKNRQQALINLSKGWGWNIGLTKETNEGVKRISESRKGQRLSEETKRKLSKKAKKRLKNPQNHPQWKGGRCKHGAGYIQIRSPSHPRSNPKGYVMEHIVVWEQTHRKTLPRSMVIHHINGIKDDNRPKNLVAMPKRKHNNQTQFEPYKKRIRELEEIIYDTTWPQAA